MAEALRLDRENGAAHRAAFVRDLLRALVERERPRIDSRNLPDSVKALIRREYARIEQELDTAGDEHYDLERQAMRCDFRIVGFGRIPVGLHHIEVGGVPRRLLWSGGVTQAVKLAALLGRAGGRAPFYVSHFTHGIKPRAFLMLYNRQSQAEWHRNVAECLRLNANVRGLLATSWWYDPQLARVSPHLAFLREGSLAHGALLLRAGTTDGARQDALANSPARQRLHEDGSYVPVGYAVVWTRAALLRWAESSTA